MRVEETRQTEITVNVDVFGNDLLVAYRPFAMDCEAVCSMERHSDAESAIADFLKTFCEVVSLWDLTEQVKEYDKEGVCIGFKDVQIPIEQDKIRHVPMDLLNIVMTACQNDKEQRTRRSLLNTGVRTFDAHLTRSDGETGCGDEEDALTVDDAGC